MRELHVECAGKRDAPAPAFRVRSARPSMWRSGTLRWTRVSAGEGASKPADERLGERTIAIKHWIEDGDLDPDCAPGVHGELDHRLQFAPAQPAASPVIHGRHDGIIESIAVNVDPEAVELGGNEARQGVRRGPPHPVPLMSHATARPRPADTSFESQTATTTGRRIESDPSRGLATLREGPAAASRHSIRRIGARRPSTATGTGRPLGRMWSVTPREVTGETPREIGRMPPTRGARRAIPGTRTRCLDGNAA
jgi:hypothetical protein